MKHDTIITAKGKKSARYLSNLKNAMIKFDSGKFWVEVETKEILGSKKSSFSEQTVSN